LAKNAISEENAVLLLENALTRERFDWQMWDLRQMKQSVELMKKIVSNTSKSASSQAAFASLEKYLDELETIIEHKDATRVIAGHTHVEQALSELRALVFGL
jgi:UDP-2,3-diacylglucosamine pyrophosphatase LpxH